ncbi:anthranilate synthase component II [Ichthyobacterium seriolicida]|uniref:Anthranilate synthase n=1 Tax=Ichthyobacterium seriolicida TaxID=242600 RepID=A0A1J1EA77_9FLAO|nr:aminodeoxychorismate/anthranilate synthase component II [Ichthyobacterium seriolicida]BAV94424.1 anthranilate synthase [Ichthyobacterium seriolicida]
MRCLVLDNYDSFTYNLGHLVKSNFCGEVDVFRNDQITLDAVAKYDRILLSPGPGVPHEANMLKPIIERYASKKSILGICLGHQAIAEVFGAGIFNSKKVYHGVCSQINITVCDEILFRGLPTEIKVGRYHSWLVSPCEFPDNMEVIATTQEGDIMALRHKEYKVKGFQFHPESILTDYGGRMIKNWIELG